jgi:hypothetical protein
LTALNPVDNLQRSYKITVLSIPNFSIINSNFIEGKNNSFELSLKVNDVSIINQEIKFTINGVSYIRKTNELGVASLSINLIPGTYDIYYSFQGNSKVKGINGSTQINVLADISPVNTQVNAYWLFGGDMKKVDLAQLSSNGVNTVFLNFYAISAHGKSSVESWIATAATHNIKVHIWMQAFYESGWILPVKSDGTYNQEIFDKKVKEAISYANIKGLSGIHIDYLRFNGNAYKYSNGIEAINEFAKMISEEIKKVNPNLILSAAVMPETTSNPTHYGQDVSVLGKYLDVIVPMIYKGNYNADTSWISKTTNWFVANSAGAQVWVGLQGYVSDWDDKFLSHSELSNDAQTAYDAGAYGVSIFRFGASNIINFNNIKIPSNPEDGVVGESVSSQDIIKAASELKTHIEKNGILPVSISVNGKIISVSEFLYLMAKVIANYESGNKNFGIVLVSAPDDSKGDKILSQLNKKDYLTVASEIIRIVDSNKKAPTNVTSPIGNIQYNTLVYSFSKILNFIGSSNSLPNYVYTTDLLDNYMLTVTMKPSASNLNGQYQSIYYTTTWLNHCPNCGYYGTLLINPKGVPEGELTCACCDSDYCGVSGFEKIHSADRKSLTKISSEGTNQVGSSGDSFAINDILDMSVRLKNYISSNDRLPNYVTLKDKQYSMAEALYLMTSATLNINNGNFSNIKAINASDAPSPEGDLINSNLNKTNYLDLANRIMNFIKTNGYAPNFASSSIGKVIFSELVDSYSRILSYYKDNDNNLPAQVAIKYSGGSSKSISDLAKSLTKDLTSDLEKATALFNYVRDKIGYSYYENTRKGAEGTLLSGSANCCDMSHLLVALARSSGLTVNYAHGKCQFSTFSVGHVWVEFTIGGKTYSADPSSARNSFGSIKSWSLITFYNRHETLPF